MPRKKIEIDGVSRLKEHCLKNEIVDLIEKHKFVEVEIGCGNGHFITHYGIKNPNRLIIGLDIKKSRCLKTISKINKRELTNIQIFSTRAEQFLSIIEPESIDAYHIYFPDPWPKTKHRKRRFLRKPNLDLISRTMKKKAKLFFATDFFDYSVQAKLLFILHPEFSICNDPPPEEAFTSVFANRFKDWERSIFYIAAEKK